MALGLSFIPNQQAPNQQQQTPGQDTAPPVQQALQMLSLRVPRFGGSQAILPPQMQQQQGPGGPVPGTPEWEELMRRLMGGGQPPMAPGAPPPPLNTDPSWKYTPPPGPPQIGGMAPGYAAPKFPTIGQTPGATPTKTYVPDMKQY